MAQALETIRAAGLTIILTDDRCLKVTPKSRITPELRELVKAHRDELLAYLEREAANDPTPLPKPCPTQAPPEPPPTAPAPAPDHIPAPADWSALDKAYQAHHINCPTCIAAGKGYGMRCGTGSALWTDYDRAEPPAPHRKEAPND
jgi:hypothetical protein